MVLASIRASKMRVSVKVGRVVAGARRHLMSGDEGNAYLFKEVLEE